MSFSLNTNMNSSTALQLLNETGRSLSTNQRRISSGLSVSSTIDDSATFTIAQNLRSDVTGLKAVTSSLNRAKAVTDVAISGVEQISDVLTEMRAKATQASDDGVDSASRAAINKDFVNLRDQITSIVRSSVFSGTNILKTNTGLDGKVTALSSLVNINATPATAYTPDTLTVNNLDLDLGSSTGVFASITATSDITTSALAQAMVRTIETAQTALGAKLGDLGAASRQIERQSITSSKLSDVIEGGIGKLVDADLAKESARLQALQVKQQLGIQALSIANQAPQAITGLFR